MICAEDEDDPFPVDDDCLSTETFSQETVYRLMGEELRIKQLFGANLGVAAPVWEAVRADVTKPKLSAMRGLETLCCDCVTGSTGAAFMPLL